MTAHTDFDHALGRFQPVSAPAITDAEFAARQGALQQSMRREGVDAVWLDASTSLAYFLGHALGRSERIHGALIFAQGEPLHVSPTFEAPKLRSLLRNPGEIACWEEDEDPYALIAAAVLLYGVDASAEDVWVAGLVRDAEVNGKTLIYHPTINTQALRLASDAQLAAAGGIVQ